MKSLIKKMLNVKTVKIEKVKFDEKSKSFKITLAQTKGQQNICPICGKKAHRYDKGKGMRTWRSLDIGPYQVFIECESPRVKCKTCGIHTEKVSWARHHSSFTRNFEDTVAWMSKYLSKSTISYYMRVSWNTIGPIISRYKKEVDVNPQKRFENLKRIGIDETSYKKGHKYITVIIDHETNKVIWAYEKHGKEVLQLFLEELTPSQRANIQCYSADGATWISETMAEYCPNAIRCLDPFHLVQWVQKALDKLRVETWNNAQKTLSNYKGSNKKKKSTFEQEIKNIKGSNYALKKAPENLTENQKLQLSFITKTSPKLYRAYCLKEHIRTLIKLPLEEMIVELKRWLWKASHSRIPIIYKLQKSVRNHYDAIINTVKYNLSNARVEAINNKIKLATRIAYGFRNVENMLDLIMLRCSDIPVFLPGR